MQTILVLIVLFMIADLISIFRVLLIDIRHGREVHQAVWHSSEASTLGQVLQNTGSKP